jgi:hypothetical protein
MIIDRQAEEYLLPRGMVIAQIDPVEFQELALSNLHLIDKRRYGSTLLCFYELLVSVS